MPVTEEIPVSWLAMLRMQNRALHIPDIVQNPWETLLMPNMLMSGRRKFDPTANSQAVYFCASHTLVAKLEPKALQMNRCSIRGTVLCLVQQKY